MTEEASEEKKGDVTDLFKKAGSQAALSFAWSGAVNPLFFPTFFIAILYLHVHFVMAYIVGHPDWCKFGEEMKRFPLIPPSVAQWFEIIALGVFDLFFALIILIFFSIVYVLVCVLTEWGCPFRTFGLFIELVTLMAKAKLGL